jgi:hypothetical protein
MGAQQLINDASMRQKLVGSTVLSTNNNYSTNNKVNGEMQMNASMPLPQVNGFGQQIQNQNL